MIEARGNLWDFEGIPAITTNGYIKKDGRAVMGRGCAKEASLRFPGMQERLAFELSRYGNHVFYLYQFGERGIITFPVKHLWNEKADLELIRRSADELVHSVIPYFKIKTTIYLARPGVGNGRLNWDDVKPVISNILTDQVCVVTF